MPALIYKASERFFLIFQKHTQVFFLLTIVVIVIIIYIIIMAIIN
jgi:hypothetical protein